MTPALRNCLPVINYASVTYGRILQFSRLIIQVTETRETSKEALLKVIEKNTIKYCRRTSTKVHCTTNQQSTFAN